MPGLSLFLSVAMLVGSSHARLSRAPLANSGTLVVIIPTRDGLVIAADRRSYNHIDGDTDTTTKIALIDKHTVLFTTGTPKYVNPQSRSQVYFDADAIARNALTSASGTANLDPSIDTLSRRLSNAYYQFLTSLDPRVMPTPPSGEVVCNVVVAHYDTGRKLYVIYLIKLKYTAVVNGAPQGGWQATSTLSSQLRSTQPFTYGNEAVWNELSHGKDPRFDHIRNDPQIRDLGLRGEPIAEVSAAKGVAFCRKLMATASAMTPLIDNSTNHIGPTVDIALLSTTRAEWIYRDPLP